MAKFYELSPSERRHQLEADGGNIQVLAGEISSETSLFDRMRENLIGAWRLPLGVLMGLLVNGKTHRVAMATEEPSVVAAVNRSARVFNEAGGVSCEVDSPVTSAQILCSVDRCSEAVFIEQINHKKDLLIERANASNPGLVAAGGGAFDLQINCLNPDEICDVRFIDVRLFVHTVDAMGANAVNTMAEAVQAEIVRDSDAVSGFEKGMAILTNSAPGRFVHAKISIPFDVLSKYARMDGAEFSRRMERASLFAEYSPQRAVTHNKGIMNGIIAAAIPLGQDTRAMSAAFYDAACSSGKHAPMARWFLKDSEMQGILKMPMVVGFAGGFRVQPAVEAAFAFDGIDSYQSLCSCLAAVGLAQNMAALWALTTDGIQAGHMKLHERKVNSSFFARDPQVCDPQDGCNIRDN